MLSISGIPAGAAQALAAPRQANEVSPLPPSQEEARPAVDRYTPEEKPEFTGRYWVERDENGQRRICFDSPPEEAEPRQAAAPGKGQGPEDKQKARCTGDTGPVDREIRKLKQKKDELERRRSTEQDELRRKELEQALSQVEQELRQKDNDTYRRQHTVFS